MATKKEDKKLTEMQAKFVQYYPALNFNGAQAAIKAGFSPKTARETSYQLLRKPHIQKALSREASRALKNVDITPETVLKEIKKHALGNIQDIFDENGDQIPIQDLPPEVAAIISEVKIEEKNGVKKTTYKLADKKGYVEMMAKYFKLLTEKHEHTGADGGPMEFSGMSDQQIDVRIAHLIKEVGIENNK